MLLAVPNVSEGRDRTAVQRLVDAFLGPAALLDFHFDAVHNRTVATLAGEPAELAESLLAGASVAVEEVDMRRHDGAHPCIGAVDICPIVYVDDAQRPAAHALATTVADLLAAELSVPIFLYGELATDERRRERAHFREGGLARLAERMNAGELMPDRGPSSPHPSAGATLVTARAPLAAFNIFLDSPDPRLARLVANQLRESGGGLPGVRAIGLAFEGVTQVSTNVHDPVAVPLAMVVDEVRALAAPLGARATSAELVGLVPEAALRDFPTDVELIDPNLEGHVLERRLESLR